MAAPVQHKSLKNYARMSRKNGRVNMADMAVWSYETHRKMYNTRLPPPVKKNSTSKGKFAFEKKMANNILEDLADRYDRTWNLDANIKTISYPPNIPNDNGKAFGPMMNKMKEKMRLNSAVFDRTLSRASVIKINIANGIENNETIGRARNMLSRGSTQIGHVLTYVGMGKASTIPIAHKVRERHLELEPLCCLSSCLVRGGCTTVVVFEIIYVILTLFACAIKFYDGGRWKFWEEIEPNFNAIVTHRLFLYIIIVFDIITTVMVLILLRGLFLFDRLLVKRHWRFDFFALGFNVFAFIFFLLGVSSQGPETWSFVNILMVMCFAGQIFLQLWAITVVKSCFDFFVLLYVFIKLGES